MFETEGIICARTRAGERLGWLAMVWAAPLFLFIHQVATRRKDSFTAKKA